MQIWPPVIDPKTLTRQVWSAETARALPGVGRALSLYGTLAMQMPMDDVRGTEVLPRPRLLEEPDLTLDRPTFVAQHVEDWWLHGNACHLVTSRDGYGQPATCRYFPAALWNVTEDADDPGRARYFLRGVEVPERNVVHVRRGVDPAAPYRGVGVVEQHIRSLDRAGLQEEYEREGLRGGGVPSVAVIAPQKELTQEELDEAGDAWVEKFGGPVRRPGIFPNGTQIVPLSWSPNDQQLTLARQTSLTDLANLFNLDPYWLGAPGSSHKYQSPAPMFVALLRTSLERVLQPIEAVWSREWLPRGRRVTFQRVQLTRDDFGSMVTQGVAATQAGLMSRDEWRVYAGLAATGLPEMQELRVSPAIAPAGETSPDPTEPPDDDTDDDTPDDDQEDDQ